MVICGIGVGMVVVFGCIGGIFGLLLVGYLVVLEVLLLLIFMIFCGLILIGVFVVIIFG